MIVVFSPEWQHRSEDDLGPKRRPTLGSVTQSQQSPNTNIARRASPAGNESVPKVIVNNTIKLDLFCFKLRSVFWQFQTVIVSGCCSIKLLPYYIYTVSQKNKTPNSWP